jgi:membrane-bound lytic murein transglycosylase B
VQEVDGMGCGRPICAWGLIVAVLAGASPVSAGQSAAFAEWLAALRREAVGLGIRAATLDRALAGLAPLKRVIELDRNQPEFKLTFEDYLRRVVPASRVEKGRRLLGENRDLLEDVARRYGVQARFIVAFWGIESDFGRLTGGFRVVRALATLAHDGRRSAYFRGELLGALRILDDDHIGPGAMTGSWAGAMGQPQFMPSSFLAYAVDHDGDGRKDIWTTKADVFASAANYLARSGWKGDQTWGRRVRLPGGFDSATAGLGVRKRLSAWQGLGVRRADGTDLPRRDLSASIVFPGKPGGPAYAVYDNFRTILKWNRSTYFAVAVGSLADRIGGG